MAARVSRKKNLSSASETVDAEPLLRISEVARRVGISSSALRAWESLGLVVPQRTPSKYRLYTMEDVRVLQRAIFLRRARGVLETTKGVRMELLAWGNKAMEPHLFRIKPGSGSGEPYTHEGEEFLHVIRGRFEICIGNEEHYKLKPGDSLYFESSTPHRWRNPGSSESWLLWINTPPTF